MAERLTERQRDILSYIKRTLDVEGVAPSIQEIQQEFGCGGRIRLRIGEVQGVPGAQGIFDDTGGASGPSCGVWPPVAQRGLRGQGEGRAEPRQGPRRPVSESIGQGQALPQTVILSAAKDLPSVAYLGETLLLLRKDQGDTPWPTFEAKLQVTGNHQPGQGAARIIWISG